MYRIAIVVVVSFAGIASAQTGIALRMTPWEDGVQGEAHADASWTFETETDNGNADFSIGIYDLTGRVRLDETDPHSPAVGWQYSYFDLNGNDTTLPRELVDMSIAFGMGVTEIDGWGVEIVGGVGYAGQQHFNDGDAVYGIGALIVGKRLGDDQALRFYLSYDGNRSIFPDIPLPGVAWWHRIDSTLQYTVGIPFSSIIWTPADDWTVTLNYTLPLNITLKVAWDVHEQWQVFAMFDNRYDAFTLKDGRDHQRLFYQQRTAELGAKWMPCDWAEVSLSGGVAFDQEFETGFDTRDTTQVAEIDAGPFVRARATVRF